MMKYLQIVVIDGMNCSRCASKVRNALEAEPTVSVKIVDLRMLKLLSMLIQN